MVLLVRLRASHTPLLKVYANFLDSSAGPLCPICHRQSESGCGDAKGPMQLDKTYFEALPLLKALTTALERVLVIARVTLR